MNEPRDEDIARMLWSDMKAQAQEIAKMRGPAPQNKNLTPDEELLLYNQTAKGWTAEKEFEMLAAGKSREEVGLAKFDQRGKLSKSGGRALSKLAQAKWMATMARKADPHWQPPMSKAQEPALPPGLDEMAPDLALSDHPNQGSGDAEAKGNGSLGMSRSE